MHRMIIFDDGLGQFGPITDLRASFEIRTGVHTTGARIAARWPKLLAGYWVPSRLRNLVAKRANAPVNDLPSEEVLFCVNGRWAMPDDAIRLAVGEVLVEASSGAVICGLLRRSEAEYFFTTGQLHERIVRLEVKERALYKFPWDILTTAQAAIPNDILNTRVLDAQIPTDVAQVAGQHPVEIHKTARIYPSVVFDAEQGPILVCERAVIRPGSVICGPCCIGSDSTVIDRALIKPFTVIGPHCKVAGEVGATIFQGYSNKAHDGHLGDSWVGKWVNLGAGTTNSNLLNTYGEVTMRLEPDGARFRTGRQFLGAIVGDHVKTAICTRIMTGTVIGTGAMIAMTSPPPTAVRRFAWLTDAPQGERTFQFDKFIEVAKTVMARRHVEASSTYLEAIRALFEHKSSAMNL